MEWCTLQASSVGIQAIRKTMKRKSRSQTLLAGRVRCSRQTIGSLLKGNPIDEDIVEAICQELGLDWQEMIVKEAESSTEDDLEIQDLIADIRQRIELMVKKECGKMRVLDMEQDIALEAV